MHAAQPEWTLSGANGTVSVPVRGRLRIDNSDALRKALLAGMGISMLPGILVDADIKAGRLIEVLPEYAAPMRPINLLYLRDRQMSPKLRSFVEFVVERFGGGADSQG